MEQFCRDRLSGVRRLADQQKTRAAVELQQQHRQNPNLNHGQRDFHRDKGHGRNFVYDRKRELYRANNAVASAAQAGQKVSPPKNEAFTPKLNPEVRPFKFNSNAPTKCDFPNCNQSAPHFLRKCPVFRSKPAFDRQKRVTAKNLCVICFKKVPTHMSQCRVLELMKKLDRKICGVNGCNIQHNYLLHPDQGKASVNMFTVLQKEEEVEDAAEEMPASEDKIEDDQSPRVKLMRGILQAGGFPEENQESNEDSSEEQTEAIRETEVTSEDEKKLEPEREKNPRSQGEEEKMEYCSMEAIAERWRDKPKREEAASTCPEAGQEADIKPMASVPGIKGKKNPTLLLAELLQIEGNMAVMQYDTEATASLVSSNFMRKLNLFSRPKRVQVSITSGLEGEPEEATLMHELYIRLPRGSAHSGQFLEVEKIRRLPRPPAKEVLDEIFPHPDRQEWVADWGLSGGEVDILLGADMIHLFPKLDHTVKKLSLYMSFLTERYIVMGQMLDNSPEEQLEAIRRFTEEHSYRGGPVTTISQPRGVIIPPSRRSSTLEVTVREPDQREVTYSRSSVMSGTVPRGTAPASTSLNSAAAYRPIAPPTDVPAASVRRLPPSQRPPRPARTSRPTRPYRWRPPSTQ